MVPALDPRTNGSGSGCFSAYFFLKVHLHHFSKIKSQKRSHKLAGIKVLLTIFA
jgi:hypothetical protein